MSLDNIYWAKDIIFLVVDQNEIGIQSWLDEYHGIQSKCKLDIADTFHPPPPPPPPSSRRPKKAQSG
jgi:hypothetical protein